jgi:uncharacterized damage-inducible protein DinB
MEKNYFLKLFKYDHTVNTQLLGILKKTTNPSDRTRQLFSHILTAQKVWMMRLKNENLTGVEIWPDLSWDECRILLEKNWKTYQEYLDNISDDHLEKVLTHKTSKGKIYHTPRRDILMQVIIHGGHHRGQIAKELRALNVKPPNTDYIAYLRDLNKAN